jgi:hypothetical protein
MDKPNSSNVIITTTSFHLSELKPLALVFKFRLTVDNLEKSMIIF